MLNLLDTLRHAGLTITSPSPGRIRLHPGALVTPELAELAKEHKALLLDQLLTEYYRALDEARNEQTAYLDAGTTIRATITPKNRHGLAARSGR